MRSALLFASILFVLSFLGSCKGSKSLKSTTVETSPTTSVNAPIPKSTLLIADADSSIIQKAQLLLYLHGFKPGKATGELTTQTLKAFREFQLAEGLDGPMEAMLLDRLGVGLFDFQIEDLQNELDQKGFDPGPIDNMVGPMTMGAYQAFLENFALDTKKLTSAAKAAIFSEDSKYFMAIIEIDPLFLEPKDEPSQPELSQLLPVDANLASLLTALKYRGYDPGEITANQDSLSPPALDALFRYQVDKELPIGGFNSSTLRSLGVQ